MPSGVNRPMRTSPRFSRMDRDDCVDLGVLLCGYSARICGEIPTIHVFADLYL